MHRDLRTRTLCVVLVKKLFNYMFTKFIIMKKKNHLQKITVAIGVVVMSLGLLSSYNVRAKVYVSPAGSFICYKTFSSGTTTYTKCSDCLSVTGSQPLRESTCTLVTK